ncbi:MAG: hypothetical protein B1H11_04445 [Desulfobacteraceae bacterium 4484_190.1]|nr:MAG: hypothetical protein B1H11_04445 [Desulfobacteraceae bacterium 4484_190.1]
MVIIGRGVMGLSTAYHLMKADNRLKVCFVEKDPVYERCSSMLSMANVRVQFGLKENIQISQYTLERLKTFDEDMAVNGEKPAIGHRKEGNLFLVDEQGQAESEKSLALQQSLGCRVEWWSPAKIMEHYPLYKPDCYMGGTFGADDGYLDPYAFVMAYKKKAVFLGATFVKDEVVKILTLGGRVDGVRLRSNDTLRAKVVVNCAGAWAAEIAKMAGIELPVVPTKRQVFCLKPAMKPEGPLPLTLLPSGLYFRSETGDLILLGKSMDEDPIGFDFSWDDKRFYELLWPELAEFVPAFDTLKLMRGWAGLYAVSTLDDNAFIGEWFAMDNYFIANGFSGHGLQQAPAVGRYLSELILGLPPKLDLSIFKPDRIIQGNAIREDAWAIK